MINWIKDKIYWRNIYSELKQFLSVYNEQKILLYGYPKSGNTWIRFLLYNYRTLLIDPRMKDTISYDRLNFLQNNVMDRGTTFIPEKDYPFLYRTHKIFKRPYSLFDFKIFIHRNPLDTLISSYYFYKERRIPFSNDPEKMRDRFQDIDYYVRNKISDWIKFYHISVDQSDFNINYSLLKKDCFLVMKNLIRDLGWEFNEDLIRKSIVMSSFDNIKQMGIKKEQQYGNGPKDGSFMGEFTRSGKEGQYIQELDKETISFVKDLFPDFNSLYN